MSKTKIKKKEINEAPKLPGYSGLTYSKKPIPFTPDALLDLAGVPKASRPSWLLRPMGSEERHMKDAEASRVSSEAMLWAAKKGINLLTIDEVLEDPRGELQEDGQYEKKCTAKQLKDYQDKENLRLAENAAYNSEVRRLINPMINEEIVRRCIVGIKSTAKAKNIVFLEDEEDGYFSKEEFNTYNPKLIDALTEKVLEISENNMANTLGL